ncbi:MAG: class I SAM-dependent methyltransferase [Anaerolineae bacterium]|nr:class I SAM-dependent methyltransferase [Anaerolineae bacterium]
MRNSPSKTYARPEDGARPFEMDSLLKLEHVRCNLCGADDAQLIFPGTLHEVQKGDWEPFQCTYPGYGHHLPVVQCQQCGLRYTNPRFTEAEILARYEDVEDPTYLEQLPGRLLTFGMRLRHLERFTGPPAGRKLLDIGAHVGGCVRAANARGWDAYGLEPGRWAVATARRGGLDVRQGTLQTNPPAPESLDVVTLWDVIEHYIDPLHEARDCAQVLKPGGWLVVHTMDCEALLARLMGKRWPWLMEMHMHYFSRRTLAALLEAAGFEVKHIFAEGRFIRLDYLITRIAAFSPPLAAVGQKLIEALGLGERAIKINTGDLITVYARKPE